MLRKKFCGKNSYSKAERSTGQLLLLSMTGSVITLRARGRGSGWPNHGGGELRSKSGVIARPTFHWEASRKLEKLFYWASHNGFLIKLLYLKEVYPRGG